MKNKRKTPPRWMDWIIELYCHPDLLEDLQGDLHEYYSRNVERSRAKADFIFLLDVLKFCRPYTIQKPKFLRQMTTLNLFRNYFKTSIRSLARNRLFSAINIIGLSVAMSIGILMITYIGQLLDYDEFHDKKENIYKVYSNYTDLDDGSKMELASTSVYIGDKLREECPGISESLLMTGSWALDDFTFGDKTLPLDGYNSSDAFFDVFSIDLLSGNPETALVEPYSIVLTETSAKKFFKGENPVGKTLTSGEDTYQVTGLMQDPPSNTHLGEFDMLISFSTLRIKEKDNKSFNKWNYIWSFHTYVLLDEYTNIESTQAFVDQLAIKENEGLKHSAIRHYFKNISDVTPGKGENNNLSGVYVNWEDVNKLIILTIVILASSCFNYTNLSIARSLRRAKEVGIRKVVGAGYSQVFSQFIFEAILISLLSLIFAFGLYLLIKPGFEQEVVDSEGVRLFFTASFIPYLLLFAVFIGFVAGIAPAMVLSKLRAIAILGGLSQIRLFKGMTLRKVLVVFQFAVSMILIISSTISYRQYVFSINHDMGFRMENILNVSLYGTGVDYKMVKNEFAKIPEVKGVGTCLMIPGTRSMYGGEVKYKGDSLDIFMNKVDGEYLKIHDIQYLAGGSFHLERKDSIGYVVIDEKVREKLGFETAQEAIGEIVQYGSSGWKLEISGVMDGYEYTDLQNPLNPTALIQNYDEKVYHINLLLESSDMISTMDKLESAWRNVDEVHPFKAEFYDVQIQDSYAEYRTMFGLFLFLASLAILISTLGLLGIAVFTTETRIKEISIRKVLGATEGNLVSLLTKSFVLILSISALVAIPVSYFLFDQYVLVNFRERITIGFFEFAPGVFLILLIAILTVSWQTLKASKTNPADMLRNE